MKHQILSILVMTAAMATVACSDDKQSAGAGPQTCTTNPTLPGCSLQKAALAQVPGSPEAAAAMLNKPYTPPPGGAQVPLGPNGQPIVIPGVTPPGQLGTGIAVTQSAISARASQIAAALEADSHDPRSSHYIAPKEDAPEPSRAPASMSTASASPEPVAPPAIEGSGEAAR